MKRRILKGIAMGISLVGIAWLVASYINVMNHNMTDHVYASWNFFNLFTR